MIVYNRTQEATAQQLQENSNEEEEVQPLTLVDHYIALLLTICIESGLLEVSGWISLDCGGLMDLL